MPAAVTVTVTVTRDSVTATVPGAAVTPGAQPEAPWQWRLGLGVELESPNPTAGPRAWPESLWWSLPAVHWQQLDVTRHVKFVRPPPTDASASRSARRRLRY